MNDLASTRRLNYSPISSQQWTAVPRVTGVLGSGLCNRMRGIFTSMLVAQELGFGHNLFWVDEIFAHFLDLFENPGVFFTEEFPSYAYPVYTRRRAPHPSVRFMYPHSFPASPWVEGIIDFELLPRDSIRLTTWYNLKPSHMTDAEYVERKHRFLSSLRPVPEIQTQIDAIAGRFTQRMVGVHLRTTDTVRFWKDGRYPPLELYLAEMDACLAEAADTRFFVCADDDALIDALRSRYGSRILSSVQVLGRSTPRRRSLEGQQAAVVDLYCLAKTGKIIGTRFSSFSYEAAALGAIPLTAMSGDPIDQDFPDPGLLSELPG